MKTVKHYFIHNAKERRSTIWIVLIACLLSAIPFLYPLLSKEKVTATKYQDEIAAIEFLPTSTDSNGIGEAPYQDPDNRNYYSSYNNVQGSEKRRNFTAEKENLEAPLFAFDPNTISKEQWITLGLKPSAANRVMNYISAGAKFYKPEDIRRIWGVSRELQNRLVPYVKIVSSAPKTYAHDDSRNFKTAVKPREYAIIELNAADSTGLISLPGIGEKLSQRIIAFRNKLGGFNRVEQIREVYGIHDSVYQQILPYLKVDASGIQKIKINEAGFEQFNNHPYIRYKLAKVIVNYREQHGRYNNAEDLKKIVILDDENLARLLPYISFD